VLLKEDLSKFSFEEDKLIRPFSKNKNKKTTKKLMNRARIPFCHKSTCIFLTFPDYVSLSKVYIGNPTFSGVSDAP